MVILSVRHTLEHLLSPVCSYYGHQVYKFLAGLEINTSKQTNKQKIKDRRLKKKTILENVT